MEPRVAKFWQHVETFICLRKIYFTIVFGPTGHSPLTAMKLSFILSIFSYWATKPGELLLKSTGVLWSMVGSHSINPPVFTLISSCQDRILLFFSLGKVLMR